MKIRVKFTKKVIIDDYIRMALYEEAIQEIKEIGTHAEFEAHGLSWQKAIDYKFKRKIEKYLTENGIDINKTYWTHKNIYNFSYDITQ